MRISRATLALAIAVMLAVAGCTTQVTGTAERDPAQAPLTLSEDGFGIVAGFEDAPTRIEIFTEPQCTHCADLQHDFGDQSCPERISARRVRAVTIGRKPSGQAEVRLATGDEIQHAGAEHAADDLRHDVRQQQCRREAAADAEADRHGRIEMTTGDRAERIRPGHHCQPERQ